MQHPFLEEVSAPAESSPKGQSCGRCHHPSKGDLLQAQQHCRCQCTGIILVLRPPRLDSLTWQERIQPFGQKMPQPCPCQVSMRTELLLLLDPSLQWHQMKGALLAPAQHQCPRLGQPSPQLNTPLYFCRTRRPTRSPLLIVGRPGACQQRSDFPPGLKNNNKKKSYHALPKSEESNIIIIQGKRFSAISHLD